MQKEISVSELEEAVKNPDLTGLIGIDPETGEFDINMVPENIREDVMRMAKAMASNNSILNRGKMKCRKKKKVKAKVPRTYGINKKKKKKK